MIIVYKLTIVNTTKAYYNSGEIMETLTRQEKVIYTAPTKRKKRYFLLNLFLSTLIFVLLVIEVATFLPVPQSNAQGTSSYPMSLDDTLQLLYPSTMPNATSSSSLIYPLDAIRNLQEKPLPASPSAQTDFCLNVPVLYYHHIQPLQMATLLGHAQLTIDSNIFLEQMRYLFENGYTTVSADQLVTALINRQQLPEKTVVITIDDGYEDAYSYVFPVMKEFNFVASLMIPAGLIEKPGYLTWLHLKDMTGTENIKIYNHTWSHAPLGLISPSLIDTELASASAAFKTNLNLENNTVFTYPYGSYNQLAIDELKKNGFYAAFTTEPGTNECISNLMTLPRKRIGNEPMSAYGL